MSVRLSARAASRLSAFTFRPVCAAALLMLGSVAQADVVISQVFGGNGGAYASDYVELFNNGSTAQNLSGWSVQYASATGTGNFVATALTGSIQPGQYHLVKLATTTGTAVPTADSTGSSNISGTSGKLILANTASSLSCNGGSTVCTSAQLAQIVDLVGYGTPNFFEAAPASPPSTTTAIFRANGGCTDTNNNAADFTVGAPAPRNSSSPVNACTGGGGGNTNAVIVPSCPALSVLAGNGGTGPVSASDADGIVNNVAFAAAAPAGISLTSFTGATGTGATATAQVAVSSAVAAGSYPLSLTWSNNQGQTASCALTVTVNPSASITPIAQIQGDGATSPLATTPVQNVTTQGVVTRVNNNGFFMQSQVEDGNPATSDGIFVFTSTAPAVAAGQLVQVTGNVVEFNTGAASNAMTLSHMVTELSAPVVTVLGSGYTVTPTVLNFPATDAQLEAVEGMLVQINQPLTASQNYFLGRYGQVTLGVGGRLIKPTNIHPAGSPAALALAASNAQRQILLDDGSSQQNVNPTPYIGTGNTLRAGDTLDSLTGVIDYGLSTSDNTGLASYKIHPTQVVNFTRSNPRTSAPAAVGNSNVKVGSFNVLNFFTTFQNGATAFGQTGQGCSLGGAVSAANCRGANNLFEFNRQRDKIVRAISALNADVVGLMEIQNNGNTAAQNLVDGLNAFMGAGTYAVVPAPTPISGSGAGTGTDAIRVAMIYKPAKLSLVGGAVSDTDPIHNRPPLAQTFAAANGEKFSVVVNHFKSKGSCPTGSGVDADQGDGQGCWNGLRTDQAAQLRSFIGSLQALRGDSDVLVIGDLNAYGKEDPVLDLTGNGFTDLLATDVDSTPSYSYVFDGEAGYLDHALASSSLRTQVTGAAHWAINADEPLIIDYNEEFKQPACATCGPDYYSVSPYRSSDHDPVIVGLSLLKGITGTNGRDTLTGTAGDDRIAGLLGADTLTGGDGADVFAYNDLREGRDTITDFTPGTDKVDLRAITATLRNSHGATGDLLASGHIRLFDTATGVEVRIDTDGNAGPSAAVSLVLLKGVSAAQVVASRDLLL